MAHGGRRKVAIGGLAALVALTATTAAGTAQAGKKPTPKPDFTLTILHNNDGESSLLPTILDWIGVSIPDTVDGRSLAPFVADGAAPDRWRDEVFWEWHFSDPEHRWVESLFGIPSEWCSLTVVRTRHHKLVQFAAPEELLPSILIDLEADPDHTVNHYRDPGARDALIDCLERVGRWRMRSADRTLSGHFLSATSGHVHRIDPR